MIRLDAPVSYIVTCKLFASAHSAPLRSESIVFLDNSHSRSSGSHSLRRLPRLKMRSSASKQSKSIDGGRHKRVEDAMGRFPSAPSHGATCTNNSYDHQPRHRMPLFQQESSSEAPGCRLHSNILIFTRAYRSGRPTSSTAGPSQREESRKFFAEVIVSFPFFPRLQVLAHAFYIDMDLASSFSADWEPECSRSFIPSFLSRLSTSLRALERVNPPPLAVPVCQSFGPLTRQPYSF